MFRKNKKPEEKPPKKVAGIVLNLDDLGIRCEEFYRCRLSKNSWGKFEFCYCMNHCRKEGAYKICRFYIPNSQRK